MLRQMTVYLKTTESCQLNCSHCFTGGNHKNAKLFDHNATIEWLSKLAQVVHNPSGNFIFHGGEPFLAPSEIMYDVWDQTRELYPNMNWTTTTNLTYKLDDSKIALMRDAFNGVITTSWDKSIRFATPKQLELWERNVRVLNDELGFTTTVIVSLSKDLMTMRPLELIVYLMGLGFKEIHLERIAPTGNAVINQHIVPTNSQLDEWISKFWDDWLLIKPWKQGITNSFLSDILVPIVHGKHRGCRARSCERKILTVNANGTIGGCPNNAVEKQFGTIRDDIRALLWSPQRLCNIQHEQKLRDECTSCPLLSVCNGDCQNLAWDETCPAPKTLMGKLLASPDTQLFEAVLGGVVGEN